MVLNTIIHLLTGYEGNSTFIVPKVPTIVRGNREDNKSAITPISSLQVFYYTEQLCNSKFEIVGSFLMDF